MENLITELGRVAIIGGGNMGQAVCAGLLSAGVSAASITVANPGEEKRKLVASKYGVRTVGCNTDALPADTVVLAVKPAMAPGVAAELAQAGAGSARIISVAAGVKTQDIASAMGTCEVARVMPNTPLTCGFGMSGISVHPNASEGLAGLVKQLFASMGGALVVPESKQDIVTALSGSGPAYFELFLQAMASAGQELGLSFDESLEFSLQTMLGTAQMLKATGQDLDEAIKSVSSPGGTTVAALEAMRGAGVPEGIGQGVKAAARRSAELGERS